MNGQRLSLKASPTGFSPALDFFLKTDGIQKFTAYNDFKATIHAYQHEHQVSGIIWQTLTIQEQTLYFPKLHDQLIAIPTDLDLLHRHRDPIYTFWHEITQGMDLYLALHVGKMHEPIALAEVDRIYRRTAWASLNAQGSGPTLEVILQLGWGQPEEAVYRRGFPESGSELIHAVYPGNKPLG
jgi:hypothetical protein